MKIITRKYQVYSFKELKEDARQKAIELFSDINVDHEWWSDDYLLDTYLPKNIQMDLKLLMFENGKQFNQLFNWKEIYFDLDRGNYLQFKDLTLTNSEIFAKFLKIPKSLLNSDLDWSFSCERECNTEIEFEGDKADDSRLGKAKVIFAELINIALHELRKTYEYLTSEESIVETIEANEYQFLKDGSIFR